MIMGFRQTRRGQDVAALPANALPSHNHNQVGATSNAGQPDDVLYIIVEGKFFRLNPDQVKQAPIPMTPSGEAADPVDQPIVDALNALRATNAVVADLQPPGAASASCACVALNIDVFDSALQRLAKGG
jgi:hypothetical protein